MRILILTNNDSGLIQFRKELLEFLASNNDVYCDTPNEDGYIPLIESTGCKCIEHNYLRRGINPFNDIKLLIDYTKKIREIHADYVLTYTIKPNVYGGVACQMTRVPYIANVTGLGTSIENGGVLSKISLILYRIGLRKAKCIFFQNRNNYDYFKKLGIIRGEARVLPGSGINVKTHCIEPYPADNNQFIFLFVGRVMKDKGIEELLASTSQIISEGENIVLDIVGNCDEDYSAILEEYQKKGYIHYYGLQRDVHSYYTKAHCIVLPTYHEGMANVMLEAASTGRPVIGTRIPGCQETFDEGVTGLGCEPKDVSSLKEAMNRMIHISWEERKKMGIRGRIKVEKEFDRAIVIDEYKNLLLVRT